MDWSKAKTLFLDPGKMVGWAYWQPRGITAGEIDHTFLWYFLRAASDDACEVIGYEDFRMRDGIPNNALIAVKVIGVIEEFCRQRNIPTFPQLPHEAKFYWTDARLADMGLYREGERHSNDALKHLLAFRKEYV